MKPKVVAGIINFNRADLTLRTVNSLLDNTQGRSVEVWVVDSASQSSDIERLSRLLPPSVRLHCLAANRGFGHAANAVLAIARGRGAGWAWVLNNDIVIEPQAFDHILGTAKRHDDAAAIAPAVLSSPPEVVILSGGLDVDLWRGRVIHRYWRTAPSNLPVLPYEVAGIEGSAPLIRLRAVDDIGPFDEGFFMYWEDVEWSRRASRSGWSLWVDPRARIHHDVSQSSLAIDRTRFMLRNRLRFMRMAASPLQFAFFFVYFTGFWLPAYLATRLVPRWGVRKGLEIALQTLAWNIKNARELRRGRAAPTPEERSE